MIDGPNEPFVKEILKHKKNAELGVKSTTFANEIYLDAQDGSGLVEGEEVTLMDWGNVIIQKVSVNDHSAEARMHLEGDFKKTKKKLTWLPANDDSQLTPVQLIDYDFLITKKKLEEEDSVEDCINPTTEFTKQAVGDANLRQLKKGDIIQLERRGYFICDQPINKTLPLKLISIPDGKVASTSLKSAPKPGK